MNRRELNIQIINELLNQKGMKKLILILIIVATALAKSYAYTGFVETTQNDPYQMRSYYNENNQIFASWNLYAYGQNGTYASITFSPVSPPVSDVVYSNGSEASDYGSHWFWPDTHFHYVVLVVYKIDIWDYSHSYIIRVGYASASASWY